MLDRLAVGELSSSFSRTKLQRLPAGDELCSVLSAGNHCHFVLLDNNESCPAADRSSIGRPNGPAYLTSELLNTPQMLFFQARGPAQKMLACIP